ncbi:MAG TPA: metalloregulator ArsR/SmtB family transcription factor [Caulobacteraceae bacterium]|jgi:DNA-binding transcriptional ArsR family regulator|nr:metalloregulator ArsR/SmtB family transcription factor [Caulobacteraceae bacterium]
MQAFAALADPVRAEIVQLLSARDLTAGDIASRFPISRPAVSRHLSVLRRSRLVRVRGEAQRRVYSLDTDGLDQVDDWIGQCRAAWNARLDALGRHLDDIAGKQVANWEGNDG